MITPFTLVDVGSIPGQGTRISHARGPVNPATTREAHTTEPTKT